jgi:alanine racemase
LKRSQARKENRMLTQNPSVLGDGKALPTIGRVEMIASILEVKKDDFEQG